MKELNTMILAYLKCSLLKRSSRIGAMPPL
jgi:hypothetical protein